MKFDPSRRGAFKAAGGIGLGALLAPLAGKITPKAPVPAFAPPPILGSRLHSFNPLQAAAHAEAELDRVSAENARLHKALKELIATAERVGKPTHPSYSGMLTGQAWRDGQKTAWQGVMVTASAALAEHGKVKR